MRRILLIATVIAALLLTPAGVVPSQADTAPTLAETVPAPLSATGAAMVAGPGDVPSGYGSLRFESLSYPKTTDLIGLSFDAWIYLPANTTATLVMPWNYLPEYDYVLTFPIPAVAGWQHLVLTPNTPATWTSRVYGFTGTLPLGELWTCCAGQVTSATIQLASTDGSTPHAYVDTLSSAVGSYDFEPIQQPTISSAVTTVTYGSPVTIRGTVLSGDGVALAGAPATLRDGRPAPRPSRRWTATSAPTPAASPARRRRRSPRRTGGPACAAC